MVDDRKHTEQVKVMLTERELLDLCRLAAVDDRKPSEMVRVIVRQYMYGRVCAPSAGCEPAPSPHEGPHGR